MLLLLLCNGKEKEKISSFLTLPKYSLMSSTGIFQGQLHRIHFSTSLARSPKWCITKNAKIWSSLEVARASRSNPHPRPSSRVSSAPPIGAAPAVAAPSLPAGAARASTIDNDDDDAEATSATVGEAEQSTSAPAANSFLQGPRRAARSASSISSLLAPESGADADPPPASELFPFDERLPPERRGFFFISTPAPVPTFSSADAAFAVSFLAVSADAAAGAAGAAVGTFPEARPVVFFSAWACAVCMCALFFSAASR